ncbi:peptidoglycan/LPS O-acetylase OafA/YrhL [Leifsonia sp. AK011]|uniref:acyltransferase family protein n=1 Tax=Leifsonia sp. AK011 TaxID=2723075 RepID=UPI0015CA2A76|nr:acyltransferase [Leifsonia sp. AK011]NYF11336.1 peptidoglycan/LPS O-acetylase OafA/YrhL [Leifsonia sp. AK011]
MSSATLDPKLIPGKKQLQSIQVARGFAALSVVAFHALDSQPRYFSNISVLPGFFNGGMAGVDLFFVISGFVMVLTTRGRHGKPREVGKFLWNRFFRIYPTYWFYFLLLLPVLILAPTWINASQGNQVDLVASFFLLPSDLLPILLVAWTLTIELWFYIVFAVLLFLPEKVLPAALAVWFVVLVIVNWNGPISASPFVEVPANAMAIEFIFGGVAALVFRKVNLVAAAITAVAGLAIIVFFGEATVSDLTAGPGLHRPLTLGLGFALLLLAFTAWENRASIGFLGRFTVLGDMSYSLYLSHVLVLVAMGRIWAAIAGPFATNIPAIIAWWLVTFAVVLVAGYLSYRLIERPVMGLSRRWRAKVFRET